MTIQNNISSSNITRHQANSEIYTSMSSNLKTSLIHINEQIDGIENRGTGIAPERLHEFVEKVTNQLETIKLEYNRFIQLSLMDSELNALLEKIQNRFSKFQVLCSKNSLTSTVKISAQNNVSSSNITQHQADPGIHTIRPPDLKTSLIHIDKQIDGIESRGAIGPERLREFLRKTTDQLETIKQEHNAVIQLSPMDSELNALLKKIQNRLSQLQGHLSNMG